MTLPLLVGQRQPRHVLQIGLGAASLTRFLYRHCPTTHLTIVEIDDGVIMAARQFFKMPSDPQRITVIHEDGVSFMQRSHAHYDLILVDGFDSKAHAGLLESQVFYDDCRRRLDDHGWIAINLLGKSRGFQATVARFRHAFQDQTQILRLYPDGNVVALATVPALPSPNMIQWRAEAVHFKQDTGLNLAATLSRFEAS